MRYSRMLPAILAGVLGSILSHAAGATSWVRAQSTHFVLYSDAGQSKTRDYLRRLEAFRYLTDLVLGANPNAVAGSVKFKIYLFLDHDLLRDVRPTFSQYIAGVYMHCVEGAEAFAERSVRWDPTENDP